MKIPELPRQGDVFDTIEIAHERLLASTYPLTGFGLKHSHSASGDTHTFYCRSGRSSGGVNGKLEKCDFRIRVTVDLASGKCTIGQIEDEHNHDKHPKLVADPHYIPSNGSKVAKVMERLQAQGEFFRKFSPLGGLLTIVVIRHCEDHVCSSSDSPSRRKGRICQGESCLRVSRFGRN